jgi:hypothetical protein
MINHPKDDAKSKAIDPKSEDKQGQQHRPIVAQSVAVNFNHQEHPFDAHP